MNPRALGVVILLGLLGALAQSAASTPLGPGALAAAARQAGLQVGAAIPTNLDTSSGGIVAREFTSVTLENALKWGPLAPAPGSYDFTDADRLVDWAEQNGLRVRGHTLFWGRLDGPPRWLEAQLAAAADPALYLRQLMQTHAQTVVGRYAGRIAQWDVVNEPLAMFGNGMDPQNPFFQTLGESYLDIAFRAARAADPAAALFLNEFMTEIPGKFDELILLAQGMLARGVPLDGIGLQGHFLWPPDRASLQSQFERVAALGLLVELTEVDIPIGHFAAAADPLAAQASAYADVFAACLSVSACTGITTWGIDDSSTWLDRSPLTSPGAPHRPLLFDEFGQPKPAYDAVVAELRAVPEPGMTALVLLGLIAVGTRKVSSAGGTGSAGA